MFFDYETIEEIEKRKIACLENIQALKGCEKKFGEITFEIDPHKEGLDAIQKTIQAQYYRLGQLVVRIEELKK